MTNDLKLDWAKRLHQAHRNNDWALLETLKRHVTVLRIQANERDDIYRLWREMADEERKATPPTYFR